MTIILNDYLTDEPEDIVTGLHLNMYVQPVCSGFLYIGIYIHQHMKTAMTLQGCSLRTSTDRRQMRSQRRNAPKTIKLECKTN